MLSFLKRQSVITEKETNFFNMLNKSYMTEESDGSDGELILHKHSWRSESKGIHLDNYNMWMDNYWFLFSEVNKWMEELDRRHSSKVAGKSSTPCKVRMEGAPANSLPPKDAPEWAVDPNWSKEGKWLHFSWYYLLTNSALW